MGTRAASPVKEFVIIVFLAIDAILESSGMDNGQDTNKQVDNPKVESEEKPKVAETAEEKSKAASSAESKPKITQAEKVAAPEKVTTAEKVSTAEKVTTAEKVVTAEKVAPAAKITTAPKAPVATAPKTPTSSTARPAVGTSAGAKTKTVSSEPPPDPVNAMRRRIVWTSLGAFLATCFLMFLRFFLPRTIFEPSTVFRIGYPSDFGFGVDTKFQQQYRIWVVKNAERMFVIFARCTHLGCTPDWKPSENKFKCPCHGSGYTSDGINFEGPAPRPMDRAHVELDPTGQIIVDTARLYQWPKGESGHFNDDGSFLSV
jgi:cytochrome b6-f complex iron-sulfur subunit